MNAESVDVGVVGGFVRVGHEVDDVALGTEEENLEEEVIDAFGREDVCNGELGSCGKIDCGWREGRTEVSGDVHEHVKSLRLERDAGTALKNQSAQVARLPGKHTYVQLHHLMQ